MADLQAEFDAEPEDLQAAFDAEPEGESAPVPAKPAYGASNIVKQAGQVGPGRAPQGDGEALPDVGESTDIGGNILAGVTGLAHRTNPIIAGAINALSKSPGVTGQPRSMVDVASDPWATGTPGKMVDAYREGRDELKRGQEALAKTYPIPTGVSRAAGDLAAMHLAGPGVLAQGALGAGQAALGTEADFTRPSMETAKRAAADIGTGAATGGMFAKGAQMIPRTTALAGTGMAVGDAIGSAAKGDYAGATEALMYTGAPLAHAMSSRSRWAEKNIGPDIARAQEGVRQQAQEAAQKEGALESRAYTEAENVARAGANRVKADVDKAEAMQGRAAEQAHRAEMKAENRQHRINQTQAELNDLNAKMEYEAAKQAYAERIAAAKSQADAARERAKAVIALRELSGKMKAAFDARGAELKRDMAAALASAEGEFGQIHGELLTRASDYIKGAREAGREPDPAVVDQLNYLVGVRESVNPRKFAVLGGPHAAGKPGIRELGHDAWVERRAKEIMAEQGAGGTPATPDFVSLASEQLAAKAKAQAEREAEIEAAVPAETRAALEEKPPEAPDTTSRKVGIKEWVLERLLRPEWQKPKMTQAQREALAREKGADKVPMFNLTEGVTPEARKAALERLIADIESKGERNVAATYGTRTRQTPGLKPTAGEQYLSEVEPKGKVKSAAEWLVPEGLMPPKVRRLLGGENKRALTPFEERTDAEGIKQFADPGEKLAILRQAKEQADKAKLLNPKTYLTAPTAREYARTAGLAGAQATREDIIRWLMDKRGKEAPK